MTTTTPRGAANGLGRKHRSTFRVRLRLPDGTVVTESVHPTKPAAQLRAKEIDVEVGRDTFLDPRGGRIPLPEWGAALAADPPGRPRHLVGLL